MSKIQEALDKIAASKANLPKNIKVAEEDSRANDYADEQGFYEAEVAREIAFMQQPQEMDDAERAAHKIIGVQMRDRKVFNAFRDLRTTIIQRVKISSPVIMVSSCANEGGTSFVATNLAAAIAMDETKTSLLVDCNLTHSKLDELPLTDSKLGLKEFLKYPEQSIEDIIYPTGVPRMRVIPAGTENIPMGEFFTSVRLRGLFDAIRKRYARRYIIVDAPSIAENADARILSQICDYVILVVPYGKVTESQIINSARIVTKEKLLGTVFNNQPRLRSFYGDRRLF